MDSVEYRIFRDEYASLHEGIQPELNKLVLRAYSAGLIGSATKKAATLITWTTNQKANSLLEDIDSRIKTDSRAFYDFLKVLMSLPTLQYFADRLNRRLPPDLQLKMASSGASQGHDLCQSHDDASDLEGSLRPELTYDPKTMTFVFRLTSSNTPVTCYPSSMASVNYAVATHDIDGEAERTASQQPPHVLPQDPSMHTPEMIPFQKQKSQLQLSLNSSGEEAARNLPRILTTQPSQDYQMSAGLRLDIQPQVENKEMKVKSSSSPQLLSPVSTHSSDQSPIDSFKTAFSHISPRSSPEVSDEEATEFESDLKRELKEIAEKELNRIAEKYTKRFSQKKQQIMELKQKLKDNKQQLRDAQRQKEKALKQLEQRLAEKEQQLATQIPYPQQETEPRLTELETKLRLTQEHLEEVEDERKSLAGKLFDAKESLHSSKKQLLNTKIQLITFQKEAHDHKMENIRLKQHIQDLENRVDFFFENVIVCSRRRSQSV